MAEPSDKKTDLELVKLVQKGNKRSFDLLVIKYQHRVVSIVSRFVKNPADAQDVAQETFIKAYRAIGNFRGDSAFYTWLYRITVNTAKNHLLTKKRRPSNDVDIDDADFIENVGSLQVAETPENAMIADELKLLVHEAINSLSEDLKAAIVLRELEGFSYEEIADALDCPVGTVRSRIFRARDVIDKEIKAFMGADSK